MRTPLLLIIAALASCVAQQNVAKAPPPPALAPLYSYRVVNAYPHDPKSFTEGLFYQDGFLYESTGVEGTSSIRKERLETGEAVQKRDIANTFFGEGIVAWKDKLYELTWKNQQGFIYNLADFQPKGGWNYVGEGWALTRNDRFIIMSDGTADLRFLDPDTLAEDHRISVTLNGQGLPKLNEIEWIKGEIWANVFETEVIVRIDPNTGRVVGRVDMSGLLSPAEKAAHHVDVLNGIAYDAQQDRIFVTGKYWPKLFEIRVVPHP